MELINDWIFLRTNIISIDFYRKERKEMKEKKYINFKNCIMISLETYYQNLQKIMKNIEIKLNIIDRIILDIISQ